MACCKHLRWHDPPSLAPSAACKIRVERLKCAAMTQARTLKDARAYETRDVAYLRIWLTAVAVLVFLLIGIGGATRLTGSGLSITEWQPIVGTVPPLSQADWLEAFAKYRQIPQYEHVNRGMSLEAF